MFRHMSGLEMGDALFRERRHRNNIDVARRRYLNVPEFGHYDTWLIDLLQKLIEQNTGRLLFPNWQNVTDFQDTEESFVTVPLHSQGLQNKLDETVAAMKAADVRWTPKLTADMKFLCEAWGVKLPFLPVNGKDEFRVFSRITFRAEFARFDSEQMAQLWMEYVNGYTVYPKLPSQLREYHKAWERNKRIKRAEERMKTDSEMLKSFLESKVPIEIEERRSLAVSENEYQQNLYSQEIGRITLPEARLPNQFRVVLPYYFRLQPHEPRPTVGNIPMLVALAPTVMGGAAKRRGERLKDKKSRKKRRCGTCLTLEKGNSTALQCPGRSRPAYCPNIHSLPA
ncbi:hypothetical protein IV203_016592 [Nitzschia inconspicua]|uniref:Uncharacterized protein n=1 Tax=Nitzschia inconspicua TaxID=303405 RepID=A0A9K3KQZ5_9STRA|nr:hypothetical protein IV203_016592 [Nitzschia inconspicua]